MFDPYHKWLGISREEQPPTHYRLLGVNPSERDPDVIEEAVIKQTSHVRTYQVGPHAVECIRLLNEITHARTTLLDPAKRKAYDTQLASHLASRNVDRRADNDKVTARPNAAVLMPTMRPESTAAAPSIARPGRPAWRGPLAAAAVILVIGGAALIWIQSGRRPSGGDTKGDTKGGATAGAKQAESDAKALEPELKEDGRPPGLRPGLVAELFEGDHMERRRARRIDPNVDFAWGDDRPDPKLPADHFSIRWVGWLKAPTPGKYVLHFFADDGFRFALDGKILIDEYRAKGIIGHRQVLVQMTDRYHQVLLDYVEGVGHARLLWSWCKEGEANEPAPVPAAALFHDQDQREALTYDYTPFQGSWTVNYTNGVTRDYVFDDLGNLVNWGKAVVHRKNGEWILDTRDDRLERLRVVDGKLLIDHFYPASTYPGAPPITGVGMKKQ